MAKRKPACKLIGEDGNAFSIIGRVSKALKVAGQEDQADAFRSAAFKAKNYDEVIQLAMKYVEVK